MNTNNKIDTLTQLFRGCTILIITSSLSFLQLIWFMCKLNCVLTRSHHLQLRGPPEIDPIARTKKMLLPGTSDNV